MLKAQCRLYLPRAPALDAHMIERIGLGETRNIEVAFLEQLTDEPIRKGRLTPLMELAPNLCRRPLGPRTPMSYLRGNVLLYFHGPESTDHRPTGNANCKPSGTPDEANKTR